MVGDTGIEPVTFPVSGGRSPAELIAHPEGASIAQPETAQGDCVMHLTSGRGAEATTA